MANPTRPDTFAQCLEAVASLLDQLDEETGNLNEREVQNDIRIWAEWFGRQPALDKVLMSLDGLS